MTWRFPNVEKAMVAYLKAATGHRTGVEIPSSSTLPANLPMNRIARGPGSDDTITDSFLMDVESLGANRDDAYTLAEDVRQAMHDAAGKRVGGVLIDKVETPSAPVFLSYSPTVPRYVASYRLHVRGQ